MFQTNQGECVVRSKSYRGGIMLFWGQRPPFPMRQSCRRAGSNSGHVSRGACGPPRTPKHPLTLLGTQPEDCTCPVVLHKTCRISFLRRHLDVPMMILIYTTWWALFFMGLHPLQIKTVTITPTNQNCNDQVLSLYPRLMISFPSTVSVLSFSFFF